MISFIYRVMSVLCAKFQRDTWKGLIVLGNKTQNL